jgi:diaminopimelate epimerase
MAADGTRFYKMTGSGNDFVVFAGDTAAAEPFENPRAIQTLAAHGTGVGSDGVVFLEKRDEGRVRMRYYNSDGSEAALCGNASLCSTRLAVELGMATPNGFVLETGSGALPARIVDGLPEIDLEPVTEVRPDASDLGIQPRERRMGYAVAGNPHVVIDVADLEAIDLGKRGPELRRHPALNHGANVNWVTRRADGQWAYRTYERGVEAETLACGSGAVAIAIMLSMWGEGAGDITLWTRSGLPLVVRLRREGKGWLPSLRGEGRIVFEGRLRELS